MGAFSLVVESDDVTLTRCSPGKRTSVLESSSVILLSLSCCSVGVEFLAIHRVLSNWSVAIGRFRPREAQGKVAERLFSVLNFWCIRRKTYGRQVKNKLHVWVRLLRERSNKATVRMDEWPHLTLIWVKCRMCALFDKALCVPTKTQGLNSS